MYNVRSGNAIKASYFRTGALEQVRQRYGIPATPADLTDAASYIRINSKAHCRKVCMLSENGEEWVVAIRGKEVRVVYDKVGKCIISALPRKTDQNTPWESPEPGTPGAPSGAAHYTSRKPHLVRCGTEIGTAKLTDAIVTSMRQMKASTPALTYAQIGAKFRVRGPCARRAIVGETWKHLPGAVF